MAKRDAFSEPGGRAREQERARMRKLYKESGISRTYTSGRNINSYNDNGVMHGEDEEKEKQVYCIQEEKSEDEKCGN